MEGPKPGAQYAEPPPPYSQDPGYPGTGPGYPQGGPGYPPAGAGYQGAPSQGMPPNTIPPQSIVMGPPQPGQASVTVVSVSQWGPYSMQVTCPHCRAQVMTETSASPGLLTWLLIGVLIFFGCWIGCCLIPCCIPECQDIEHRCPNCKNPLGTYRRI